MSDTKFTAVRIQDVDVNGGWGSYKDSHVKNTLIIEKDGIKISLNDKDVTDLMKTMKTFNPTVYL
ncbi:hypothetical protein NVP1121O_102 [Vibrio phage 1.121.O._10N.286.46.C4]|nr:hypothetical protein NVP1121O_102 [Vibrio phage 1.121.O._10N.286.46.C4]